MHQAEVLLDQISQLELLDSSSYLLGLYELLLESEIDYEQ